MDQRRLKRRTCTILRLPLRGWSGVLQYRWWRPTRSYHRLRCWHPFGMGSDGVVRETEFKLAPVVEAGSRTATRGSAIPYRNRKRGERKRGRASFPCYFKKLPRQVKSRGVRELLRRAVTWERGKFMDWSGCRRLNFGLLRGSRRSRGLRRWRARRRFWRREGTRGLVGIRDDRGSGGDVRRGF